MIFELKEFLLKSVMGVFSPGDVLHTLRKLTDRDDRIALYSAELNSDIEAEDRYLLPSFKAGCGRETDRFSYQNEYVNFDIKPGERVLDIGSGAYPFPYATHLVDLYEGETIHREEPLVRDGRPFEVCSIEGLPYKDKEFDFIFCSHVLEHVSDPAKACEEIMRVGNRGYIETPTRTSDIMFNFTKIPGHHKWHINILKDSLIFMEWTDNERRDTKCNDFFKMYHSKYNNSFQRLVYDNRDLFCNMFLWKKKFYYYIFDKSGKLISSNKGHA